MGVGDFSNIKLADHPLPDPSGGEAVVTNKRSRRSTQSSVAPPRRAHSLCKAWDKLGLDLSEDLLDGQVLTASQDTEEPDEQVVCNPFGTEVQTSVGIPPACAHAAVSAPLVAADSAYIPLQDRRHPGGRLRRWNGATGTWNSFFGPGGAGHAFADAEATRLATRGWAPQLEANPVQRRLPRVRSIEPGEEADATDSLVREYAGKKIVEEVAAPNLAHLTAPIWSLDTAMVHMPGLPFRVPRTVYPWVHDFFLVPKPHQPGKWRGITNAKPYNEFTEKRRFKLHGYKQVQSTVRPGDYMCGYDIQDFFPHIALVDHFKDHFIFRHKFQGENCVRWYRFVSLMFGTTDAPRSSVKLMVPVLAFLRSCSVRLAQFIDDGMQADQPVSRCIEMFQLVVNLLDHLGFILHPTKCKPRPAQRRLFLGSVADSSSHLFVALRLPVSKLAGIKRSMQSLKTKLRTGSLSLRELAGALGKARAARDSVTITYLMTRELLRWQNACIMIQLSLLGLTPRRQPFFDEEMVFELPDEAADLHSNKHKDAAWFKLINWDARVCDTKFGLPKPWRATRMARLQMEINFWSFELRFWNGKWLSGAPPPHGAQHRHWTSDASGYGAGLVEEDPDALDYESRFHWLKTEMHNSINWKELATPEPCMKAVAKEFRGSFHDKLTRGGVTAAAVNYTELPKISHALSKELFKDPFDHALIKGKLDNTTAISYIRKMGGPSPHLSQIAERLWFWLLRQRSWILVSHIAGVLNVRADRASRWKDDRSEWRLSSDAFRCVEDAFGPHSVDLFASRRNTQLPRFFSRWLDPDSSATDAMARPWLREGNPYAHPPIVMIPKILEKVKAERCEITLVAPVWASQAWISDLLDMSVAVPRLLLSENLMEAVLPSATKTSQPGWTTAVWRISGDVSKTKVTTSALRSALWPRAPAVI